ncbi:MAG: mandelate racemase/muconate lactonizing enzyme family protein [Rhodospirillales bacterium]|nr:mandelate racemase/muconate lactonizing enzyme family protein [Rhodospirillales bacterium]
MQLTRVDTWLTRPSLSEDGWIDIKPFLFVRVMSDDGYEGWGEAYAMMYREVGIAAMIHTLGREAMAIEDITPAVFRSTAINMATKHRGIDYAAATSALEMAIWDMEGRRQGLPLHRLLGESVREEVPVYANIWSNLRKDDKALAERAEMFVTQGYRAVKFYPLQFKTVEQAVACTAEVRGRIGESIDLMFDFAHPGGFDTEMSRALAPLVRPYSPYWIEEPVDGDDLAGLATFRAETKMPIVTGERHCGVPHFRNVIRLRAADILNPDIAAVGGLLDMLQIGAEAEEAGIMISTHCWNSMTVAAAAMLHVSRVIPNAGPAEIATGFIPFGLQFADPGFEIVDGVARLSETPGLGVTIDVEKLTSLASQETTERGV